MDELSFQILGAVRAWRGCREIDVGTRKPRAVLAVLLLHADRPVSVANIARFVWGDSTPASVAAAVHTYVATLRGALDPGRPARSRDGLVSSSFQGYRLRVDRDRVDAFRFRRLLGQAQAHWLAGRTEAATQPLATALALYGGRPLADLCDGTPTEATALEHQRLSAGMLAAQIALTTGAIEAWLPALVDIAASAPLHEPLQAQLMLAYRQAGRRADALVTYDRTRRALRDELGIGPSPQLHASFQAVLADDRLTDGHRLTEVDRLTGVDRFTGVDRLVGAGR